MESSNSWDFVDKIIYINLEEAIERRKNIEEMFANVPQDKIIRFNAIKHNNGAIGCSKSHIECLRFAIVNNWNNVLIIEDDLIWNNYETSLKVFENLSKKEYDVILLGGVFATFDKDTYKLYSAQTTTAYFVSKHYYEKLLNNFVEGVVGLIKTNSGGHYAVDQYWKKLQKIDNWYIVNPALIIQRPSYSYIVKENVNYIQYFNI